MLSKTYLPFSDPIPQNLTQSFLLCRSAHAGNFLVELRGQNDVEFSGNSSNSNLIVAVFWGHATVKLFEKM